MIKGILIELQDNYGVILTEEGLFLKIKRFGSMIEGQPVLVTEEDIVMESKQENTLQGEQNHPRKKFIDRKSVV